jgi:hypothetical protein
MIRSALLAAGFFLAFVVLGRPAHADAETKPEPPTTEAPAPRPRLSPDEKYAGYMQLFATTFVGEGLRFNNPYRLQTPLGNDAESLSLTSPYVDMGLGATFGGANGWSHGMAFRVSLATSGVRQAVLTPSYLLYRRWPRAALYGRVGAALVAQPETSWGGELGAGGVVYVRAGIGVAAELVGDVFYGAGTREVAVTTYPVLSGQLGLVFAYEVFP